MNNSKGSEKKKVVFPEQFRGMMPILPTTINEDGSLDLEGQRRLVRYCMHCGAVSIGHMGFASEFFKLTRGDRRKLIETVADEVGGRVPVFSGVTGPSTRIAIEYAQEAVASGADMLMLATPYVTIPTLAETKEYFREVCRSVEVPVILQDTPLSDQMVTAEVMVELSEELPNLRYVKAEGKNFLAKTARLFELCKQGAKVEVIGGAGGKQMIHMLKLGVTSFMTGTEALDLHADAVMSFLKGDAERSAKIFYDEIMPYFIFYDLYPEKLLKQMLHRRGIVKNDLIIPPAVPINMSEAEQKELDWVVSRLNWKKDWADVVGKK